MLAPDYADGAVAALELFLGRNNVGFQFHTDHATTLVGRRLKPAVCCLPPTNNMNYVSIISSASRNVGPKNAVWSDTPAQDWRFWNALEFAAQEIMWWLGQGVAILKGRRNR
jgi:hypothetical protein